MRFSYVIGMVMMSQTIGKPRYAAPPVESLCYLYEYASDLVCTDEGHWTWQELPRGTPSGLLSMWAVFQESILWNRAEHPTVFQYGAASRV